MLSKNGYSIPFPVAITINFWKLIKMALFKPLIDSMEILQYLRSYGDSQYAVWYMKMINTGMLTWLVHTNTISLCLLKVTNNNNSKLH